MAIQASSTQKQVASTEEFKCTVCLDSFIENSSGDSRPVAVHNDSSLEKIQNAIFGEGKIEGQDTHVFHVGCIKR